MIPSYSVLMPLFYKDNPQWFEESLTSMLEQSVAPAEIVIIHEYENGKLLNDVIDTARVKYPNTEIVDVLDDSLIGKGLGGVLAEGVNRCRYEYVARMDSDDISKGDRCEKQLAAFLAFPDLTIVGGWIDEFEDSIDNIISVRKVPETTVQIKKFSHVRNPFNHPAVMFKKEAVLAVGNYAALPRCEDYDLWVRMLADGQEALNLQESLVFYRTNEAQRQRRKDKKAYDIRREIKRGIRRRGEMGLGEFAWTMTLDFANYHAPMALFTWGTQHLLRSKKENK